MVYLPPKNQAQGTLANAGGISAGATSLTLDAGQGALFSAPTGGDFGVIAINDDPTNPANPTGMRTFTGRVGDTLSGLSNLGPHGAVGHAHGAIVAEVTSEELLNQFQNHAHAHSALSGVSANQHHAQAHAIGGADHSGSLGHAALSGVTADQHHAQAHSISGADHTGSLAHSSLSGLATGNPHTQYEQVANKGVASGYAPLDSGILVPLAYLRTFGASGGSHSAGQVPDPGASAGTTRFLREDASWQVPAGGSAGHTIQDEGSSLAARSKLNFVGAGVTVTDDSGNDASVVTIPITSGAGVRAYHSADQNINDSTETALAFDSERRDDLGEHDPSTNSGKRLTAVGAGWRVIAGSATFAVPVLAGTVRRLSLRLNGTTIIGRQEDFGVLSSASVTLDVGGNYYLANGDYVELMAYQDSGALLAVKANGNYSPEFSMVLGGGAGGASVPDFIHLQDQKASGTDGGTFTSGAWQTRTLNTEVSDAGNHCALSGNQFTLDAGTYEIFASTPAWEVQRHKAKLYNVTDAVDVLIGWSAVATADVVTVSVVKGRFTIGASKALELRHRCGLTQNTTGFGVASGFGVIEVYAEVVLYKVA